MQEDGSVTVVSDLQPTGRVESVYSLSIDEFGTYFVCPEGGELGVWAHNVCKQNSATKTTFQQSRGVLSAVDDAIVQEGLATSQAGDGALSTTLIKGANGRTLSTGTGAAVEGRTGIRTANGAIGKLFARGEEWFSGVSNYFANRQHAEPKSFARAVADVDITQAQEMVFVVRRHDTGLCNGCSNFVSKLVESTRMRATVFEQVMEGGTLSWVKSVITPSS